MISISVSATLNSGDGVAAHIVSDHPLNHLLHPDTAAGPWGIGIDLNTTLLTGHPVPAPLVSLGEGVSDILPRFLHLGFNDAPLDPGITLQGTEINWPHLGIGQGVPGMADSTLVVLKDLLK